MCHWYARGLIQICGLGKTTNVPASPEGQYDLLLLREVNLMSTGIFSVTLSASVAAGL